MRIPSGVVDQYLYFVAVDSADLITPKTGLSSFTVYRSRNGGAAAAYTTPTVAEVSAANMPGWYTLLLDEDMTIGSGNDSEEVALHITQASMAPVRLKFELYRNVVTAGETLTVASGIGDADVEKWLGQTVAAVTVNGVPEVDVTHWRGTAAAAPTTAGVPAVEVIDIAAAGQTDIRAAVGLASANLDTQLSTIDDFLDTEMAAVLAAVDTEVAAIKAKTDSLTFTVAGVVDANVLRVGGTVQTAGDLAAMITVVDDFLDTEIAAILAAVDTEIAALPTAAAIADAVWDEDATAHQTQGTFGQAIGDPAADTDSIWALVNTNLDAAVSTRLPTSSYTSPLSSAGTRGALGMASANLDTQLASLATAANLATVDTVADAIAASIGTVEDLGTGATLAKNLRDMAGVTFDETTDTLEDIRNRLVTAQTSLDDLPTNAELATALGTADDAVLAAIAALNDLSAAEVNAEVVDALNVDTYAEPGQGTPAATASLVAKIGLLTKMARNKSTVTATQHSIFNDDAATVDHKRTLSEDGTTFTSGELTTGP